VGARTEHLRLSRLNGGAPPGPVGTVTWVEHLGDQNHMHITLQEHRLTVLADPDHSFAANEQVVIEPVAPLLFDEAGQRVRA
jgi:multiple sugar transport system ATP-binding protein